VTFWHPGRCRFWKCCPGYSVDSVTCERNNGQYYGSHRFCGLWRRMWYSGRIG